MRRFRITKLLAVMALVLAFGGAMTMSAQAFVIDFFISPGAGQISYAGGDAPLVGANIPIVSVLGIDTPDHAGIMYAVTNGFLNFATGNQDGSSGWNFLGGGTITITGTTSFGASGTLLENTTVGFLNAQVISLGDTGFKIAGAAFMDTKNEFLKSWFGVSDLPQFTGALNISFLTNATPPDEFISDVVLSGDVANAPVPPSVLLLGSGLLGLTVLGWRRKKD